MNIWHDGAGAEFDEVNGVTYVVWTVATEQARLGHAVTLLLAQAPSERSRAEAARRGLRLRHVPATPLRFEADALAAVWREGAPDLVHQHSVFIPRQAWFARTLRRAGVPYVVTPHALSPQLLARRRWRKLAYRWLLERPRLRGAAALTGVTEVERDEIARYLGAPHAGLRTVFNPVDVATFGDARWAPPQRPVRKLVYLGRFDIVHKGIDRLVALARALPPTFELHLHGHRPEAADAALRSLLAGAPPNLHVHPPVFGAAKCAALLDADAYLQCSRWEVFGISVAEAMALGLPVAITRSMALAGLLAGQRLGSVLDDDPAQAAAQLQAAFADPAGMHAAADRARDFARTHFAPRAVAQAYLDTYADAVRRVPGGPR